MHDSRCAKNVSGFSLLAELSKKPGETAEYLETSRAYRTEEDVFEDFTEEERLNMFGKAPATIYENLLQLEAYRDKLTVLKRNKDFDSKIINSFKIATLQRWSTDISNRVIGNYINEIRSFKKLHSEDASDLDISNWIAINSLRHYIMKDSSTNKSLFTRIKIALNEENYNEASDLLLELDSKMSNVRKMYYNYTKNLLDI